MSALTTRSLGWGPGSGGPTPTPLPTIHHARAQLAEVERLLLAVWTASLPDLETTTSARVCCAHRAVHQAMLLLEGHDHVVADVGPLPGA